MSCPKSSHYRLHWFGPRAPAKGREVVRWVLPTSPVLSPLRMPSSLRLQTASVDNDAAETLELVLGRRVTGEGSPAAVGRTCTASAHRMGRAIFDRACRVAVRAFRVVRPVRIVSQIVGDPLRRISDHVVCAERGHAQRSRADRLRLDRWQSSPCKVNSHDHVFLGGSFVAPRMNAAISPSRGFFPLGLCRELTSRVLAIGGRLLPAHAGNRDVGGRGRVEGLKKRWVSAFSVFGRTGAHARIDASLILSLRDFVSVNREPRHPNFVVRPIVPPERTHFLGPVPIAAHAEGTRRDDHPFPLREDTGSVLALPFDARARRPTRAPDLTAGASGVNRAHRGRLRVRSCIRPWSACRSVRTASRPLRFSRHLPARHAVGAARIPLGVGLAGETCSWRLLVAAATTEQDGACCPPHSQDLPHRHEADAIASRPDEHARIRGSR